MAMPLSSPPVLNGPPSALTLPLDLDRVATWEVYRRLQNLAIPCQCGVHQPLRVSAETPLALAQIWSVIKTQTAPKADLAAHLNRCWQQRISK
jgi:hypothetical protein